MERRLVDLEIRYTHLERQLNELNQVVFEQQRAIDTLVEQLRSLRARADGEEKQHEKPPHY
jgi:SlyX protein